MIPPDPDPDVDEFEVGTRSAPSIVFPLTGPHGFSDTFGAPRDGGRRRHAGIDIFANKGVPVVAVADGVVEEISEAALAGQYVIVRHDDGWRSKYLHLDNDTPGTDDGRSVGYAPGIEEGMRVTAGTLLGFVGDSGNAEDTAPHLHFALHQPDFLPINPYDALRRAPDPDLAYSNRGIDTLNTSLVGHLDPGGLGFNGDLALHGDLVFLGTSGVDGACPGTGVRVIDVSDPTRPSLVTTFADRSEFPGTATASVWVGNMEAQGDDAIAVVGLSSCDRERLADNFSGIAIYDVADAATPSLISTIPIGEGAVDLADLDVIDIGSRLLVAVAVPGSYLQDDQALGDIRIFQLAGPDDFRLVSHWDMRDGAPSLLVEALAARVGQDQLDSSAVAWSGRSRLLVTLSSAGSAMVDVSDLSDPRYLGSTPEHDTYGLVFGNASDDLSRIGAAGAWIYQGSVLVQDQRMADEPSPLAEEPMWGSQSLFDFTDPSAPRLLSTFQTLNSRADDDGRFREDGLYNPNRSRRLTETYEIVAWLSDGVRVLDMRERESPTEVAYFVPVPTPDPQGWWVAPDGTRQMALTWDVTTDGELVYLSDVNSGLWIVRVRLPVDGDAAPVLE